MADKVRKNEISFNYAAANEYEAYVADVIDVIQSPSMTTGAAAAAAAGAVVVDDNDIAITKEGRLRVDKWKMSLSSNMCIYDDIVMKSVSSLLHSDMLCASLSGESDAHVDDADPEEAVLASIAAHHPLLWIRYVPVLVKALKVSLLAHHDSDRDISQCFFTAMSLSPSLSTDHSLSTNEGSAAASAAAYSSSLPLASIDLSKKRLFRAVLLCLFVLPDHVMQCYRSAMKKRKGHGHPLLLQDKGLGMLIDLIRDVHLKQKPLSVESHSSNHSTDPHMDGAAIPSKASFSSIESVYDKIEYLLSKYHV
jgi:hypothetical protein